MGARKTVRVGSFYLSETTPQHKGLLAISDPCHKKPSIVIHNAWPGYWHAEVILSDEGKWGERVAELRVVQTQRAGQLKRLRWHRNPRSHHLPVDSGQAGVFCLNAYQNAALAKAVPSGTLGDATETPWYAEVSHDENHAMMPGGVNCQSGFGDGFYRVQRASQNGGCVAVRLVFIERDHRSPQPKDAHP